MAAALLPSPPSSVVFDSRYHPSYPMESSTVLSSAHRILDQPPPPTLREILNAYKTKGDGDRDLLLAMLSAKTAEDQRLAETASLHKRVLDSYQQSMYLEPPPSSSHQQSMHPQQWASPALFAAGPSSAHASTSSVPPPPSSRSAHRKRYRSRSPLPPSPTDSSSAEHASYAGRSPRSSSSRAHASHPYAMPGAPQHAYAESYSRSRSPSNASVYSRHCHSYEQREMSPPVRRDSR